MLDGLVDREGGAVPIIREVVVEPCVVEVTRPILYTLELSRSLPAGFSNPYGILELCRVDDASLL